VSSPALDMAPPQYSKPTLGSDASL
jgi:hypothetical protein